MFTRLKTDEVWTEKNWAGKGSKLAEKWEVNQKILFFI